MGKRIITRVYKNRNKNKIPNYIVPVGFGLVNQSRAFPPRSSYTFKDCPPPRLPYRRGPRHQGRPLHLWLGEHAFFFQAVPSLCAHIPRCRPPRPYTAWLRCAGHISVCLHSCIPVCAPLSTAPASNAPLGSARPSPTQPDPVQPSPTCFPHDLQPPTAAATYPSSPNVAPNTIPNTIPNTALNTPLNTPLFSRTAGAQHLFTFSHTPAKTAFSTCEKQADPV